MVAVEAVFSLPGRPRGPSQSQGKAAAPPEKQQQQQQQQQQSAAQQAPPRAVPPLHTADLDGPFPPLARAATEPASLRASANAAAASLASPLSAAPAAAGPAMATQAAAAAAASIRRADPYHLAPEDAFHTSVSPPWDRHARVLHTVAAAAAAAHPPNGTTTANNTGSSSSINNISYHHHYNNNTTSNASSSELRESRPARRLGGGGSGGTLGRSGSVVPLGGGGADSRSRSRRRRRRRTWKKLLWVKQSYPDNYTDQATFLENLQRNPRVQPYDFWPLVADSTVIVQHVCSVIIFVVCFVGIFQERVSPVAVVGGGSLATCLGWLLWEWWAGQEQRGGSAGGDGDGDGDGAGGGGGGGANTSTNSGAGEEDKNDKDAFMRGDADGLVHPRPRRHQLGGGGSGSGAGDPFPPPPAYGGAANGGSGGGGGASGRPSAASSTTSLLQLNVAQANSHRHGRGSHTNGRVAVGPGGSGGSGGHGHSRSNSTGNNSALPSRNTSTSSLWQGVGLHAGSSHAHAHAHTHAHTHAHALHTRPPSAHGLPQPPMTPATPGTPRYPPPRRAQLLTPLGAGGRTPQRIATIKSAVLIYFTLLGLSPILKSLTRSTSSDSIWSMSFWLLAINVFFFDYSGVWVGAHKFPVASLSTNAALMASTVLASRLPSTGQVFSLTLFSIEVFGLFPVFRRYARHRSWRYHVVLTVLLVLGAGAGVGIIVTGPGPGPGPGSGGRLPWRSATAGMVVACLLSAVAMGGCSWWLIGLQKYKNEIYGPWDPARPVIISRRHWNDV